MFIPPGSPQGRVTPAFEEHLADNLPKPQAGTSSALAALLARDDDRIAEDCRTILLVHDEPRARAVLLFHGLTASPKQFERLARELHGRGHNVLVPRLPHHGRRNRLSDVLAGLTSEELTEFAQKSLSGAREIGGAVTVAGFSLGGLLTLWLAQRERLSRAVAIAPFLGIAWIPNRWMSALADKMLSLPNRFYWWDPVKRERQMPAHGYPQYPTHALGNAYRLARSVMSDAQSAPPLADRVVFVTNRREIGVNNRAVRRLMAQWNRFGATTEHVELTNLWFSHDIIDSLHDSTLADRAYPAILAAVDP
ncbi:MAG: alpha/beta hydrolase [Vulcanimicrobiaceae bacterium]